MSLNVASDTNPYVRIRKPVPYAGITVTRGDMVALTRRIIKSIPDHMLFNPKRPFIICVDGTIECGKKLVADIGRDTLFPGNEDFFYARMTSDDETAVRDIPPSLQHKKPEKPLRNVHGRENYAEYASGNYKGKDLTVSFVNIAYGNSMRTHVAKRPKTEGIVFAHNGPSIRQNADIAIWMERDTSWLDLVCPEADDSHMTLDSPHFTDDLPAQFQHAVQNSCAQWVRYVDITINNTALAKSEALPRTLQDMNFRQTSLPVNPRKLDVFHIG